MSKFNKNGTNLKGTKLKKWVEAEVVEVVPAQSTPPDTGAKEPPKPKPQGKKRTRKVTK